MKQTERYWQPVALAAMLLGIGLAAVGCKGGKGADKDAATVVAPQSLTREAALLKIFDEGDFHRVEITNPWDTAAQLASYILVPRGTEPDSLPAGEYVRVDVPLERSLVYSSVHAGVIDELGAAGAVAGVADGEYFTREPFVSRIAGGEIVNVGQSMSPSLEKIVALAPDAVLVSPFENAGHGVIDGAGVPVIECADYMERTPKGRAEWVKFFGLLYGVPEKADSIFNVVEAAYDTIAANVAAAPSRPIVLTEMPADGYWFVPGGNSYVAALIADAGAEYPWRNDRSAGSLQLDFSSVYAKAADADFWLIRTYGRDLTLDDLRSVYLLNTQFKAFKNGNVFVANSAKVPVFEDAPFHPERLLMEYATIFHPEVTGGKLKYFHRAR